MTAPDYFFPMQDLQIEDLAALQGIPTSQGHVIRYNNSSFKLRPLWSIHLCPKLFIGIDSGKLPVITPIFGGIDVTVYSKRRNYYYFDALYDIKYDEWDGIPNDRSKVLGRIYKATH